MKRKRGSYQQVCRSETSLFFSTIDRKLQLCTIVESGCGIKDTNPVHGLIRLVGLADRNQMLRSLSVRNEMIELRTYSEKKNL